jgi:hypothetical protein
MAKLIPQFNELAVAACTNAKCGVHRVTVTAYPSIPSNLCCPACRKALGDAVRLDHASLTQEGFGMTTYEATRARSRVGRKPRRRESQK